MASSLYRILSRPNLSLFLATADKRCNSLRRFASAFFKNDGSNSKTRDRYTYIACNKSNVSNWNRRAKGQPRPLWFDTWILYLSSENHTKSLRGHDASNTEWTLNKSPFPLEERREDFILLLELIVLVAMAQPCYARKEQHDYNSRWKLSLHRRHWNPRHQPLYR